MTDEVSRRIVVGGAVCDRGRFLAARRTAPAHLAGRWEFPGGKVEPGETPRRAIVRELREELGIEVEPVVRIDGEWPIGNQLVLQVWRARLLKGAPRPLQDHDQLRWLTPENAFSVDWLDQDRPAVGWMVDYLSAEASTDT